MVINSEISCHPFCKWPLIQATLDNIFLNRRNKSPDHTLDQTLQECLYDSYKGI